MLWCGWLPHCDLGVFLPRSPCPGLICRGRYPLSWSPHRGYRLLGLAFAAARRAGRGQWYQRESSHESMPIVLDPPLTTRSVRTTATSILPGLHVRRLVFWRYLLTWRKPTQTSHSVGGA